MSSLKASEFGDKENYEMNPMTHHSARPMTERTSKPKASFKYTMIPEKQIFLKDPDMKTVSRKESMSSVRTGSSLIRNSSSETLK